MSDLFLQLNRHECPLTIKQTDNVGYFKSSTQSYSLCACVCVWSHQAICLPGFVPGIFSHSQQQDMGLSSEGGERERERGVNTGLEGWGVTQLLHGVTFANAAFEWAVTCGSSNSAVTQQRGAQQIIPLKAASWWHEILKANSVFSETVARWSLEKLERLWYNITWVEGFRKKTLDRARLVISLCVQYLC